MGLHNFNKVTVSVIVVGILALVITVFIILGFLANLLTSILLFVGARTVRLFPFKLSHETQTIICNS